MTETPSRRRSLRIWLLRLRLGLGLGLGLAALVGVILGTVLALLATQGGSRWLIAQGLGAAEAAGLRAEVEQIEGTLLGTLTLSGLRLADAEGVWLTLSRLSVTWRPAVLGEGRLWVDHLALHDLTLTRLPVLPATPEEEEGENGLDGLRALHHLTVRGLELERVTLGEAVAGVPLAFSAQGRLEAGRVTLTAQRSDAPGDLSLSAVLHDDSRLILDLAAFEPQGGAIAQLLGLPGTPALRLSLNGEGLADTWEGRLLAEAQDLLTLEADATLSLGPVLRFGVRGTGVAGPLFPLDLSAQPAPHLTLTAEGEARADALTLSLTAEAASPLDHPLLGPRLTLSTRLVLPGHGPLAVESLHLAGAGAVVAGRGTLDLATLSFAGLLGLEVPDLSPLGVPGSLVLSLDIAEATAEQVRATLSGEVDGLILDQPSVDALLGGRVELLSGVDYGPHGLALPGLFLETAGGVVLRGDPSMPGLSTLAGAVGVEVPDLAPLGLDLTGSLRLDLDVAGPVEAPVVAARLSAPGLALAGQAVEPFTATATATLEHLVIEHLAVGFAGVRAEGQARVPHATGLVEGALALTVPNTAHLPLPFTSGTLGGTLRLSAEGAQQAAHLIVTGTGLGGEDLPQLSTIALEARVNDLLGTPGGDYRLTLGPGSVAPLAWERLGITGRLTPEGATASLALEATGPAPFTATAEAAVSAETLRISALRVEGQGHRLALGDRPAVVRFGDGATVIDPLRLWLDEAALDLSATLAADRLALTLEGQGLPLSLAALAVPDLPLRGAADLSLTLSGPTGGAGPRGEVRLSIPRLDLPEAEIEGLSLSLTGTLAARRLALSAEMTGIGPQPGRATASLPLSIGPGGAVDLSPQAALTAEFDWTGPVAALMALYPQDDHRLSGTVAVAVQAGGTLAAPALTGTVTLRNGVYENVEWGTLLRDLTVTAALTEGDSLDLTLTATDGGTGRLDAGGRVSALLSPAPLMALRASLDNAMVARRDDLKAAIDLSLSLTGTPEAGRLEGTIRSRGIDLVLGDGLGGGVARLEVEEINRAVLGLPDSPPAPPDSGAGPPFGSGIVLAVEIDLPNRLFVRGMGVDTEWRGQVSVSGTLADPQMRGGLSVVRGGAEVLGKPFLLERGVVDFRSGEVTNPVLDVLATHQAGEITALVAVTGTAQAPEVELSSRPALPEDEVISRVLFGKGMGHLGPGEAVAVARAAAQLSGVGGGGPDLTGMLRDAMGLDVLSFGGGADGPLVEAGTYLQDGIYVGVEQGTGPGSGAVTVEVELTPSITLETRGSQGSGADLGINWKWDY